MRDSERSANSFRYFFRMSLALRGSGRGTAAHDRTKRTVSRWRKDTSDAFFRAREDVRLLRASLVVSSTSGGSPRRTEGSVFALPHKEDRNNNLEKKDEKKERDESNCL